MPAPRPLRFFKGHALGNDYLVVDAASLPFPLTPARVRSLCHRERGVGADGIVAVDPEDRVQVWNADGSQAEVSGNGLRIAALYLHGRGRPATLELRAAGRAYPIRIGARGQVSISLPPARVGATGDLLPVTGGPVAVTEVDVGNPHAVLQASEVDPARWPALAALIEHHPRFAHRVNVERIERLAPDRLALAVHERGVGPTLASGTGACAGAAAAVALGLVAPGWIRVEMAGGEVAVEVQPEGLCLEGAVEALLEGTLDEAYAERLRAG